ncbi:MAG TPA: hypothetical protein VMK05_13915 [Burkholderiales bacterium]|nr:hypothetical protein [Burkholderiales bacterium]
MSDSELTQAELQRIVELVGASDKFSEFHLKARGVEIDLRSRMPQPPALGAVPVESPRVGRFRPAQPPIEAGSRVAPDTVIGYIDVLGVLRPVAAARAGTLARILAGGGEPVEYGQPLALIAPDA